MLSFFRRLINSKVGVIVTFVLLGVIALMFGMGDIAGLGGGSGSPGDSVASVANSKITEIELRQRAQTELDSARQQQPTLDMVQFVNGGGIDGTLDRIINTLALTEFARQQGMVASKRLIDGRIASLPQVQGADGKFSQTAYEQLLTRIKQTDKQIRGDIANDTMTQHLIVPTIGASQVPANLALPYASLLLERREGQIGFIPTPAMGKGTPPTEAELTTFYNRNRARYTVPERRVVRYAVVAAEKVKAGSAPSDADVAKAYQAQRAQFQPTEKRDLIQVVMADQSAAAALLAKVKAGTPIEAAARAAGLEPNTLKGVEKTAYTAQSSPELANAAFGAAKGAIVGPLRSALGYTVVRVDGIQQVAGKSLEQAKPELVKALTDQKALVAMTNVHDAIDDAIGNNATFDEIVADQKLQASASPALIASGTNPDDPASKPDPAFAQALAAAFAAEQGDDPQLVPFGQDGSFAVVSLARVVPSAARKPAEVHEALVSDFVLDRAQRAARQAAVAVTASVNKGVPLAQAISATKLAIPGPRPINVTREQIAANPKEAPAPLILLFSMAEKRAKLLEAPNNGGWFVIYLNHIERGNAAGNAQLISATRNDLGKVMGREYVQQFSEAVRHVVGVKKNAKAIAEVKTALNGQGASN